MRWILRIEYEYVRIHVYSIVLQAVIVRRNTEKKSPRKVQESPGTKRGSADDLYDGFYLGHLLDAGKSIMTVVVDEIFPAGSLASIPARTHARLLVTAMYMVKVRFPRHVNSFFR